MPETTLQTDQSERGLLAPERVAGYPILPLSTIKIMGGKVTYALQGAEKAPLILYFHGWGDDYRVVLPLEYPLIDEGYRLLVFHRPGYAGTALYGHSGGKRMDWRTPDGSAKVAGRLLDRLLGAGSWRVFVVGTSGGAPAALAFASLFPHQVRALILQAGLSQPWTDAKYVPEVFRDNYLTAFRHLGWAGSHVSQAVFGLLATLRRTFSTKEDTIKALAGSRLADARRDPAFSAVASTILLEDAQDGLGRLNDARKIFFSTSAYCWWERISAPALILHDRQDPFVPFAHAEAAHGHLPHASMCAFELGGHIFWLGREAPAMHQARVAFLRDCS